MLILLAGASGFIGSRIAQAIEDAGHTLVCGVRDPDAYQRQHPQRRCVALDFAADDPLAGCRTTLERADAVVNAVGIAAEHGRNTFHALHARGPIALFEACADARVKRVLQLSALGADAQASTTFHLSKRTADEALLALPVQGFVLQPSLVFGIDGASTQQLLQLAAAPLAVPLPQGAGAIQPVHVDDVVATVMRLLLHDEVAADTPRRLAIVGPEPLPLRGYLAALRAGMGLRPARFLPLPRGLMDRLAAAGDHLPGSVLNRQTWQMLQRGNVADAHDVTRLLGRAPRAATGFVGPLRQAALSAARLPLALALLRLSLALVWLVTAVVSYGLYPVADSLALLARTGITGPLAVLMLYGAATFDLALGLATLLHPRRWLWWAQLGLMGFYTVVITLKLPDYWLHPYGPVLKNLPIAAALCVLLAFEKPRQRRRGAPG
ncbi:SDR family oxidoreductase [Aquincola sp. J276]|uniref:SDR family oxidoreductase n=1 Tax=Aquincola sp. J276 TaxID=2898432 RepID=UPI002150DB8F|nr:SDR family oxidoreductase [Aquincola sp. J276]MCR5868596.1 SDR family oxidoreductase [Aquincola sp. J276]